MFCYTVTASLSSQEALDPYLDWLKNGHIQALLPWALDARVVVLDVDSNLPRVQSIYRFTTRQDFEEYQSQGAAQLQAEGKELAKRLGGISFTRTCGTEVAIATRSPL